MMLEILNNAVFESKSLDLNLNNIKIGQKQRTETPHRIVSTQLHRSLYNQHPYASPTTGSNRSLQQVNTSLLKKFRDQFIVTQNMNIAITGNLTSKEATKLGNKISSQLRQGTKAKPLMHPLMTELFNIIHIPLNTTQSYVSIGHLSTTRDHPDRLALEVASKMLGGSGLNSLLMKELRIQHGYTYSVSSHITFSQAVGMLNINYSTRQDQLMESLKLTHKALIHFSRHPIDPYMLEETKMGLLRAFPITYSSNASINAQLGAIGFYQESIHYLNQYQKNLQNLTALDIQTALRKHIHPDKPTFVILGPELDQDKLH